MSKLFSNITILVQNNPNILIIKTTYPTKHLIQILSCERHSSYNTCCLIFLKSCQCCLVQISLLSLFENGFINGFFLKTRKNSLNETIDRCSRLSSRYSPRKKHNTQKKENVHEKYYHKTKTIINIAINIVFVKKQWPIIKNTTSPQ